MALNKIPPIGINVTISSSGVWEKGTLHPGYMLTVT
jgi:hypothetical protein